MQDEQLRTVVQYLRRITGVPDPDEATDGQLLERFVHTREEAAFTQLVKRHGPMVLSVCRKLLRDDHDAEDAFQATFLVLVRRAGSIGKPELFGNWLYGVAYRVALKARAGKMRRQRHEKQGLAMDTGAVEAECDDTGPLLLEEVQRLPVRYRVPVVLCYLQGKTKREASRQLGWPEGTVATRLTRARELLRGRLSRRGLVFSAAGFATVLGQTTAPAAVPAALMSSTAKAALLIAAGQAAAAGVVSANAAALTEGVLRSMFVTKMKIATVVLLAVGTMGTGAGTFAYQRYGPGAGAGSGQQVALAAPVAAPKAQPKPPAKKEKPPVEEDAADKLTVTGQVVDEQGKPLAEAPVVVVAYPPYRHSARLRKPSPLGSTKTDTQGRFRVVTPGLTAQDHEAAYVLAAAPGNGMGWHRLAIDKVLQEVTLKLLPEEIVRVRLLDLQGQPARGVKVFVKGTVTQDKGTYNDVGFQDPPENLPLWPVSATTDDQGHCSLRGVGHGLLLLLHVRDDRYTTEDWDVALPAKGKAAETVHTLAQARLLVGQVTYADTKKPVPHALVLVDAAKNFGNRNSFHSVADADGRFQIAPYAGDWFSINAYAPAGEPYLSRAKNFFQWPKGGVLKHRVDLALPRGVLLHGKIIEETSEKPVAGALLGHWLQRKDNPYVRNDVNIGDEGDGELRVKSDADGRFQIAVFPGPGHLIVKGPTPDYLHVTKTWHDLDTGIGPNRWYYPDGLVLMSYKPGSEPPEVTVKLRRGVTVHGRVLKPDGTPASDLQLACRSYVPTTLTCNQDVLPVRNGRFALPGCDPEKSVPVFFFDAKNHLGTVVELSGKQAKEEVSVRLVPCGAARARYVDEQNKPFARHKLFNRPQSSLVLFISPGLSSPKPGEVQADEIYWANMDRQRHADPGTDAEGYITFPALIPGATYRITAIEKGEGVTKKEFTVEAGKTLELGDIVLKREE